MTIQERYKVSGDPAHTLFTKATSRAVGKYGPVACTMAFDLNESGEGASSILFGHDCGFKFVTVGQVDAAINAGRELYERRKWTASHGVEAL